MNGKDVRVLIKSSKLNIWQVADKYGVADTTFSKYLRPNYDFNDDDTERVLAIIDELKANA